MLVSRKKRCLIKLVIVFNVFICFTWILWSEQLTSPEPERSLDNTRFKTTDNNYPFAPTKGYAQEIQETGIKAESKSHTTMDSFYGDGCGLNPHQKKLKTLLRFWNELTRDRGIEYIVCHGSLLGYQRNRDFIPYDHDIDICMSKHHFARLLKLESSHPIDRKDNKPHLLITKRFSNGLRLNCEGTLVSRKMDPCSIIAPAARVILGNRSINFLDVFLYTINKSYRKTPSLQYVASDIYPTKPCWLAGVETRCPRRPKTLLEMFYGPGVVEKPSHVCKDHQFVAANKSKTNHKLHWYIRHTNKLLLKRLNVKKM